MTDIHSQLRVDTRHLKKLDYNVAICEEVSRREMENRTDKLQTDLTDYTNFKIEKEVAIRDEKFVELDEEVRVFKDFNTSVTADLTK